MSTTPTSSDAAEPAPAASVLRIVAGHPTRAELAALVVVLSAGRGPDAAAPLSVRSPWSDPARRLVGPSGWRGSALPR
ncbi:MAG: acyl-CoA carboxylase subunit epsilon [Terracoccus sp.]